MTAAASEPLSGDELGEIWAVLSEEDRIQGFTLLDDGAAEEFFLALQPHAQAGLIEDLPPRQRREWMRLLEPDDAADVVQETDHDAREALLVLLDGPTRNEVRALLAYAEDAAGGLMSPRFARVRPEMTVAEAISYLRRQALNGAELIYYAYVLDADQHLLGIVSFRQLLTSPAGMLVDDLMETDLITVREDLDQEEVSRIVAQADLMAVPVVDVSNRMRGVITVDDVVDVVHEETTEDVHKFGGLEALDSPYLNTSLMAMIRKRGGWLTVLFIGELLTASAMARYQDALSHTVVLALFLPLIISSGGNSGSQAATLIIRAMALGEVRLWHWWRILRREILSGLSLGLLLGGLGMARVLLWQSMFGSYGASAVSIALIVCVSLVGVVMWGTLTGSMLPLLLHRIRLDPASASAPFVATLVDVVGLVIYFTVADVVIGGSLAPVGG